VTNDEIIIALIMAGRLRVDAIAGLVYAPKSNTPDKPIGALTTKGYLRACINVNGRQHHFMVHRIVWVSVHGPLPDGYEVDHGDRLAKTDNRIEKLEAVPGTENMRRAKVDGAFVGVGRRDGIRDDKGRFGKKAAGRLLDGREHSEMPA
jgi:HNH endonuclease